MGCAMATLIQRKNGTWYTQIFNSKKEPKKKRIYHATTIREVAEAYHCCIVKDLEDGLFDPWRETWSETLRTEKLEATKRYHASKREVQPVTLKVASKEYLNEKKTQIKQSTHDNYSVVVNLFVSYCGESCLTTDLTPFVLREFLELTRFSG